MAQAYLGIIKCIEFPHAPIMHPSASKAFENSFDIQTIGILYILVIGCHGMGLPPGGDMGGGSLPTSPLSCPKPYIGSAASAAYQVFLCQLKFSRSSVVTTRWFKTLGWVQICWLGVAT